MEKNIELKLWSRFSQNGKTCTYRFLHGAIHLLALLLVYLRLDPAKQTRDIDPMLFQWWSTVCDAGLALKQHWVNVSCLLNLIIILTPLSATIVLYYTV